MSTPQPALDKILKATCGLNAGHPQFLPPPFAFVAALDAQRKAKEEERKKEGKLPSNTLYDLSGNIITLE